MATTRGAFTAFRLSRRLMIGGLALIGAAAAVAVGFNLSPAGQALAHYRAGAKLSCCGEPDPVAMQHFNAALRLDPHLFEARRGLAAIFVNLDKEREAESLYAEAIRLDRSDPRPYYELAELAQPEHRAQAIRHLKTYLSMRPEDLQAWYQLARCEEAGKQWSEVLQVWESIARRFPDDARAPRALLRLHKKAASQPVGAK